MKFLSTILIIIIASFTFTTPLKSAQDPLQFLTVNKKPTICLNMIVKNESEVICKGLATVKPHIDYWVIVDTGSTDGTQDVIKNFMKDIPGEVHERPWVNFGHNRNEALKLAKGKADYVLWMDADDYLTFEEGFVMPFLDKDSYFIDIVEPEINYLRRHLIKNSLDWRWEGVLHEYLAIDRPTTNERLEKIKYKRTSDGARSKDPMKYQKDAEVLEKALKEDPNNSRYIFYLAQTYKIIKEYEKSIQSYQKRVDMQGWNEEVFYSLLQIAILQELLDRPENQIIEGYLKAYVTRPSRAESLYYLASYFRRKGDYFSGYYISEQGLKIPFSHDSLFVEHWIYNFGMRFEYSICCYWVGDYKTAKNESEALLKNPNLPENYRESVEKNIGWIDLRLKER
jgi:glycosyltransferase involved in cell wall biosynthesis